MCNGTRSGSVVQPLQAEQDCALSWCTCTMCQATTTREKAEKERESKREALRRAATASASSRGATASGAAHGDDAVESGDELCSALRSPGTAKRRGAAPCDRMRTRL